MPLKNMSQKEYDIFISYRRVGGADKARILKTELEGRGYKVFLDYDELKDGVFDKRIMDAINSSPIFMFLLTPNSLERCLNEDDWVRKEIEYAVDNHKHFIPINPDCTFTSLPNGLSSKVKEGLGQHQFSDIMFGQLFKASINELIADRIRPVLAEWGRAAAASTNGATVRIETDLDCRILRFGKEIGMAQSGDIAEIKLPKGKHKLRFVGLESENDSYECLLSVEDLEYEDYIEVKLLEKYNARKAKEEAERQRIEAERKAKEEAKLRVEQERIEAEKRAKAKTNREAYLLSLPDNEFEKFKENDKYGFRLKSSGEVVIPCRYDSSWNFVNGLCAVKQKGKWSYVDKTGKELMPFLYDYISPSFNNEELNCVKLNGKWGFIDQAGREVTTIKYEDANSFRDGLARVCLNGKYGFIDKTGKEVIPLKYDGVDFFAKGLVGVKLNGKYGFIDRTGKEITSIKYDKVISSTDTLAVVESDGKYGIVDVTGEILPCEYAYFEPGIKGTFKVNKGGNSEADYYAMGGKWGFVDNKTGKELTLCKYDRVWVCGEDIARVMVAGKYNFVGRTGEISPLWYDVAMEFSNGKAEVKLNNEWFYIDKNGNRVK